MKSRHSRVMILAALLALCPICALAGCKKKVRSAGAEPTDTFNKEPLMQTELYGNEPARQPGILTYSLSEDDEEFTDDPNGDEENYEEPDNDQEDDQKFEDDNDDEYYDEDEPDDGDYEEDPNDYNDEESADDW